MSLVVCTCGQGAAEGGNPGARVVIHLLDLTPRSAHALRVVVIAVEGHAVRQAHAQAEGRGRGLGCHHMDTDVGGERRGYMVERVKSALRNGKAGMLRHPCFAMTSIPF